MGERANQEHLSGDQAGAGPGERTTQPPTTAVQAMLARGKRSPGDIAAVVRANPLAMREILAFLQATLGNGFVQAVVSLLAPQQAGTAAEPHVAAHAATAEEAKAGSLLGPVRVIAHGLRVRRTPDAAAQDNIIGGLHHGAVVTALAQDGEWVRIDHEGKTAYIHSHYVEPVAKRKPADGGDHAPAPAADAHVAAAPAHAPALANVPAPALAKEVADAPAPAPTPVAKHTLPEARHTAPVAEHAAPTPTPAPTHDAKLTAPIAEHTPPTPSPHPVTPTPVSFPTPQPQATAAAVAPDHNVGNPLVPAGAKEAKANDVESSRGKKGEFLHNDKAGFRATYSIGGDDVLVFVPAGGIVPPTVNIFMFFHGLAENYAENSVNTIVKDKATGKVVDHGDNAALATKLGESVTAAGAQNIIGICPTRSGASWEHDNKGGFTKIVDEVLKNLGGALGAKDPLTRGHISIAGHSAGGRALGGAATDLKDDVTDITLQDAGYGYGGANGAFMNSFLGVRDWLLEGKGGKTLRVIAHTQPLKQGNDGKAVLPDASDTRNVLAQKEGFNKESFEKRIGELTAAGKIKQQLTVTPHDAGHDWKDKTPGAHLESTLTITGSSGVQGTLQVFGIHTDHFGVRNETMDALIQNGAGGDPNIFEPGAKHGALAPAPAAGGGAAHAQLVSPVVNPAAAKAVADHPQAAAPVAKPTAPAAEHQAQAPAPAVAPVVAPPDHSDLHTAVTALANPQVNAVAHDVEMLQAQSRELGKNLDDFEETGKGRDELVAGIGSTRAKIKALASAGLDPTKLADIQGRFYRALQDLSPYYSQKRNVDILENNVAIGKGQITRTCNVTSLSMSLESIGKSANDYTGDHQQILGIAQVFQGALKGSAELALAGTGANWEAMVGLRMPDFMELVAIAHCLKGAKPTAAAVTKAAQTAFGRILDITFLRALAEEFGATAEVKFFRFDAGDDSEGSKESGTLHGFGAKKEQRHHIDKVIDARNLAEASGSKADRTKYEKLVKENQAALDGKDIETKLSVDAYKKAVIAHLGAELATGAAIETHVDNHFVRLQTLEETHVVIDDPGSFKRSNKKVLWEEARAQGMFDKRIVIR